VLTHRQILTRIWGPAHVEDVAYLRVFVSQLRQKIEADPARPQLIATVPGVGYRADQGEAKG
jgi:two-component system KDP operon response regulator KdpE